MREGRLNRDILEHDLIRNYTAAPFGDRGRVVRGYANLMGVSVPTVWRILQRHTGKKRQRASAPRVPEELIDRVAEIKAASIRINPDGRELTTEDAIDILESRGEAPAGMLKVSTVNRRLAQKGFRSAKPVARFMEPFSNHTHYLDFSRSEMIGIVGHAGEDYLLELRGTSPIYKNKRGRKFALWLAGIRDGRSGVTLARYYPGAGESLYMGLDFLFYAWTRQADSHPLHSIPYHLKTDNGAFGKSAELSAFCRALGVTLEHSAPYNKNAMGKIERTWRTLWQRFELKLLMDKGKGYRLTLAELNELLMAHMVADAEKRRDLLGEKKRVIYERDCLAYPRRLFDGDPEALASRPARRKVGNDLMIKFDGSIYEAPPRYLGQYILVHRNIKGELTGQGEADGQVFTLEPFRMRESGEYRAFKRTWQETAAENYQPPGVVKMTRSVEVKAKSPHLEATGEMTVNQAKIYIADRLNVGSYAEVAHLFDELLATTTKKTIIDRVIAIARTA
ncbi:MAG TPA: transposase [Caldithrix abyssi]|uniref:Transposase n=1 Tax=Caldithrix abyssi TaxID=187145 RepID=A0A7V5RP06_CALAY|nr:transposase [Caldithrix abyssi]